MNDKTDLLPLPEYFRRDLSHMTWEGLSQAAINYASANVEHAVAPLQVKIEELREELRCLRQKYDERTACVIVHRGSALACSDAMRAAYSDERRRAERLAEALQLAEEHIGALTPEWYSAGQRVLAAIRAAKQPERDLP